MEYPYLFSQVPVASNNIRAKYTVLFFRIMAGVSLLSLVINFSILRVFLKNHSVPQIAFTIADTYRLLVYIPQALLGITFLLWMDRAFRNLHKTGAPNLKFRKGWAVSSWFVPIISLVRPPLIVEEIWNKTQEVFRSDESYQKKEGGIIWYWWTAYILSGVVAVIIYFLLRDQNWELGYVVAMINNIITLTALLYGSKMIRSISAIETEMIERASDIYKAEVAKSAHNYIETCAFEISAPPILIATTEKEMVPDEGEEIVTEEVEEVSVVFSDNTTHAKLLIFGLRVLIFLAFLFAGICFYTYSEKHSGNPFKTLQAAGVWLNPLIGIGMLAFIATGLIAIVWMRRAYLNLDHLDEKKLSFLPNAAAYSWFIPLGNAFIPYMILQDINRYTQEAIDPSLPDRKHPQNHTLIITFWLMFILAGIFIYKYFSALSLMFFGISDAPLYGIFAAITGMVAFFLGTIVVQNISKLEAQLFVKVEELYGTEEEIDENSENENIPHTETD